MEAKSWQISRLIIGIADGGGGVEMTLVNHLF